MCSASCGMFVIGVYLVIVLLPILGLICGFVQRPFIFSRFLVDILLLMLTALIYIIIGNIVSLSRFLSFCYIIIKSIFLGGLVFVLIGSISFSIIYVLSKESPIKNSIVLVICEFCIYLCFLVPAFTVRVAKINVLDENMKGIKIDTNQVRVSEYPLGGLVIFDVNGNHYVNIQTTFYRWHHLKHYVSNDGIVYIRAKNDVFIYNMASRKIVFVYGSELKKRITSLPGMADDP